MMRQQKVCQFYTDGYSMKECAQLTGSSTSFVVNALKTAGIASRPVGINKERRSYDIRFFGDGSNEAAYFSGFIYADGNIEQNLRMVKIKIAESDRTILENLARYLKMPDSRVKLVPRKPELIRGRICEIKNQVALNISGYDIV